MLSIKYNNEFIDITPGQSVEFTRENPMYLLDALTSEYSTPITIQYSDKNVRLLGNLFFDLSIKQKTDFDVEVYDNLTYKSAGLLVIDTTNVNRRISGNTNLTGYLLTGLSMFFKKIKNKNANTLVLGGTRTLNFTTSSIGDGSDGYLQYFQSTWNNDKDFLVAPVRNDLFTGSEDDPLASGWMNIINFDGLLSRVGPYVLFPRLKYVLEQLFAEVGFKLDTSDLNGTDWDVIFLESVKPLFVSDVTYTYNGLGIPYTTTVAYKPTIEFDLAQWISPEVTCTDLLLEHCKRYGWAILPLNNGKDYKLIALKNARTAGAVKDFTKYASKNVISDYSGDGKTYSFKNEYPSDDQYPSSADLTNFTIENPVIAKDDLPDALGNYDNSLVYVYNENKWYHIGLDDTTNERIWVEYADNIYDVVSDDQNATVIDTKVTSLPIVYSEFATLSGVSKYGYFPITKNSRYSNWGMRNLFFLGMVNSFNADGTVNAMKYPALSSIRTGPDGTDILPWSMVWTHPKGDVDYGIIAYWYQRWNDMNALAETDEQNIYLPLHELLQLKMSDIINIFNVPYLIRSYIEPMPYQGFIQATLQRLILSATDATPVNPGDSVYVKFVWEDEQDAPDFYLFGALTWTHVRKARPMLYAFSDPGGTVPLNVTNLLVQITAKIIDENGDPVFPTVTNYHVRLTGSSLNMASVTVFANDVSNSDQLATSDLLYFKQVHPIDLPDGALWIFDWYLNTSTEYIIIP